MNIEILEKAFNTALDVIEPQDGIYTWTGFSSSSVKAGRVMLQDGRMALVQISIHADEEEILDACDDMEWFENLPELIHYRQIKKENNV